MCAKEDRRDFRDAELSYRLRIRNREGARYSENHITCGESHSDSYKVRAAISVVTALTLSKIDKCQSLSHNSSGNIISYYSWWVCIIVKETGKRNNDPKCSNH